MITLKIYLTVQYSCICNAYVYKNSKFDTCHVWKQFSFSFALRSYSASIIFLVHSLHVVMCVYGTKEWTLIFIRIINQLKILGPN